MFRRSSSVSAHLLSNGSCNLRDHEAKIETEGMHASLPSLVYYAAVAKGAVVVSEYTAECKVDLPAMAAACLENVPPLHISFSYTTHQRRFICLLDGVVTYCAITDEALCKADVFLFLQSVRDAFKSFGKGRGKSLTLGAHFLDEEMISVMRNLASAYVGVPRRDRNNAEADLVQRDTEADMEISSPSTVVPVLDMTDHEFALKTEERKLGYQPPRMPFIGKVRKWRKKTKEPAKDGEVDGELQAADSNNSFEVVDAGLSGVPEKSKYIEMQKLWRRKGSSALAQGSCCYLLVPDEGTCICRFKEIICTRSS